MSSSSSSGGVDDDLRLHIRGSLDDSAAGSGSKSNDGDDSRATCFFDNACLDLFLLDHADVPPQRLRDILAAAWDQDALTALRLVCHRRGVAERDTDDREGFFVAATWMLRTHPRVFADNLAAFAAFGYLQDFAQLLDRLHPINDHNHEAGQAEADEALPPPAPAAGSKRARDDDPDLASSPSSVPPPVRKRAHSDPSADMTASPPPAVLLADPAAIPPERVNTEDDDPVVAQSAIIEAANTNKPQAAPAPAKEDTVVPYRTLYGNLNNGKTSEIGVAAKWCSSLETPLFPSACFDIKDLAKDDDLLPKLLRRKVLVPLISALDKQKQPHQQTSSQAARASKAKPISKLPHEIAAKFVKEIWDNSSEATRKRCTEDWRTLVDDLRGKGCLRNCIAVCDVSKDDGLKVVSSFKWLQVCVALGLLIQELSEEPWKGTVHAFSESGAMHALDDKASYVEKVEAILGMECECDDTFNLRKVLEWVLQTASRHSVEPSDMVRTIFVFTNKDFEQAIRLPDHILRPEEMEPEQFDENDVRRWSDDYRIICDKFKERDGYDDRVPGVVLWNLRGERSAALTSTEQHAGVLSLSGYSDDLIRMFLEKDGVVHADDEMHAAIAGEEYQMLKVRH